MPLANSESQRFPWQMEVFVMVKIRVRKESKKCYFDFFYHTVRFREFTALDGTKANIDRLNKVAKKIDAEIELGTFGLNPLQ